MNEEEVGRVNKTVDKVMVRGGSSSDSGTDMMMVRCAGRQLHRTLNFDMVTAIHNGILLWKAVGN